MSRIENYLSTNYLANPVSGTKFELFYLYFSLALILAAVGYRIFIAVRGKRPAAYRPFDRLWFWGGIGFGLVGLFIYFSRTQGLPIFSTRAISYLWVLSLMGYVTYLVFYFRTTIPEKLTDYYTQNRKAKYFKK